MPTFDETPERDDRNKLLWIVTLFAVVAGGTVLFMQYRAKAMQPVIGWYNLGSETFELKPSGNRGFSYREVPPKFRIEVKATEPVSFGFVTADVFGRFTSSLTPVDFASLPCGAVNAKEADLTCTPESGKRYLLLTDAREDTVPTASGKRSKKATSDLPVNRITVKMYDWRCVEHCENLPKS